MARIFTRSGLVEAQPQKRPRASYKSFRYPRPNDCWQLDGVEVELASGGKVVVLQVEDDHSRMILASRVAPSENGADAIAVVDLAITRHGAPVRFLTDYAAEIPMPGFGGLGLAGAGFGAGFSA
jgi:transposase InsO family protein